MPAAGLLLSLPVGSSPPSLLPSSCCLHHSNLQGMAWQGMAGQDSRTRPHWVTRVSILPHHSPHQSPPTPDSVTQGCEGVYYDIDYATGREGKGTVLQSLLASSIWSCTVPGIFQA